MRPTFDLLTRAGWRNLYYFAGDRWAWGRVWGDTWRHLQCLWRGHDFSDTLGGNPWCQRCYVVRRRESD